jgi:F-type H+-transporting ATPase subunit b
MNYLSTVLIAPYIASSDGPGGLFDFNATLPLVALQFVILERVLNIIFYAPITKVLEERDTYIRETLKEASSVVVKANEISSEYEQKMDEARKQSSLKMASTEQETKALISEELRLTQKDISRLISNGTEELNLQKDLSLKTLQERVDTLSEQIKAKILVGISV